MICPNILGQSFLLELNIIRAIGVLMMPKGRIGAYPMLGYIIRAEISII
jgi:hypothetical protein